MKKKETEIHKDKFLPLFIIISIVLIIISIAFPFIVNYQFSDWGESGTFGDTFGALNALFSGIAFAGVIITILIQRSELKNQRIELQLQRNEMKETRNEFLLNRTTNLVYNQLDRFEKSLNEFCIDINYNTYKGNDAISFLDSMIVLVLKPMDKPEEEYLSEMKTATIKQLQLYNSNKSHIEKFAHTAYNSVEVLKRLIYKTKLEVEQLNDLKNLFFVNIGFKNMGVIKNICEVASNELKYLTTEDRIKHNLTTSELFDADMFYKSILDFYNLRLTEENFQEQKTAWLESIEKKYI